MQNQYIYIAFINLFLNLNTNAKMKKLLATALPASGIILACQKDNEETTPQTQQIVRTAKEEQMFKTGDLISNAEAKAQMDNYQKDLKQGDITGIFYGNELLQKMLNEKKSIGVMLYLGKGKDGQPTLIMKALDKSGNPISITAQNARGTEDTGSSFNGGPQPPFNFGN